MYKMVLAVLLALFLVGVAGCGGSMDEFGNVTFPSDTPPAILSSPTFAVSVTPSVVPTATVDYAATAVVAQATADEARRVNAEATAQHERIVQEQLLLTSEAERRVFEQAGWTVTAAGTAIPLTQTQQAVANTQIAAHQTLVIMQATQTVEAPMMLREISDAESYVRYAPLRVLGDVLMKFAVAVFSVALFTLALWLRKQPQWNKKVADEMLEAYLNEEGQRQAGAGGEAVVHQLDVTKVKLKDMSDGYSKTLQFAVPCSADALTELAEGLLSGTKTFAINFWEGSESKNFTRKLIEEVRHWFMLNRFAMSVGGGQVVLTELGKKFLLAWLESRNLPAEYRFVNKEIASSEKAVALSQ